MCSKAKFIFLIIGPLILVVWLLFAVGVLSTPRDFSSPQAVVRLVDETGTPLAGIEVGRNWYDSDIGKDGSDQVMTDRAGIARFPKVPVSVGLFTGAWRKAYSSLGMCGAGSGTSTSIYVRYHGLCAVVPKDKPLRKVGQSNQDADGIWFYSSTDSQSNTMANLSFPRQTKNIDYALSSSVHSK
jgi:hypothetical protein